MSEPTVQVPSSWFAVFHRNSLPQHPANPDADQVVPWPKSEGGVEFMPMAGKFVVRHLGKDTAHEDGFLLVDDAGEPYWQADPPA